MTPEKIARFANWARAEGYRVCVEYSTTELCGTVIEANEVQLTIESNVSLNFFHIRVDKVRWIGLDPEQEITP